VKELPPELVCSIGFLVQAPRVVADNTPQFLDLLINDAKAFAHED
jgi:hypothetical protein